LILKNARGSKEYCSTKLAKKFSPGLSRKKNRNNIFGSVYKHILMAKAEKQTIEHKITILKNTEEDKWYALYTRPRAEKLVYQRLTEAGVETFLPLQKTYRMWSDRRKLVERPLLSSYIFVKTKSKYYPVVYKINGVVKFVTFEGHPASIPQKQIDNLRLLINSDEDIEVTGEQFAKGDNVEVINGSLIGLTGELIKIGSQKRVVVRIDKLDQNIVLKIPVSFLKKI
jgi:transcriptional antiterminator RfaH